MEFNPENIGKLAIKNYSLKRESSPFGRPPTFEFIVAYDYLSERYLTIDLSAWANIYSRVSERSPLFTLDEALAHLEKRRAEMVSEKEEIVNRAFFYDQVRSDLQQTNKTNYQNEMLHLSNAYHEALRQKKDLQLYLEGASNDEYKKMYGKELKATEKALRRLDKRFHFYFGDNAEYVKTCIREIGPYNCMKGGIRALDANIKSLDKQKESLILKYKKIEKLFQKRGATE